MTAAWRIPSFTKQMLMATATLLLAMGFTFAQTNTAQAGRGGRVVAGVIAGAALAAIISHRHRRKYRKYRRHHAYHGHDYHIHYNRWGRPYRCYRSHHRVRRYYKRRHYGRRHYRRHYKRRGPIGRLRRFYGRRY